jgi:hypothetical protein
MKNRGLVLTCLLVLLASCTPISLKPTDTATPQSGGSSAGSEIAEYLSWYHGNGLALVLEMGQTLTELDKLMSNYDIAGMCELPRPTPTRFRDQLIAKPAPKRVAALRDKTLQLLSEFDQAESDIAKYCATIDTDALGRAADHMNKFSSIAEQVNSELSALDIEYGSN